MNLKLDNVVKVYSGKRGCMCGCNGTYKYATAHQDECGYEPETSDRACKRMFNIFKADPDDWKLDFVANCVYREVATRINVIYFKEENQ